MNENDKKKKKMEKYKKNLQLAVAMRKVKPKEDIIQILMLANSV